MQWASVVLPPAIAVVIAWLAWRAKSLSPDGALAAAVVGWTAIASGAPFGVYLLLWFGMATLLSRAGAADKAARTAGLVEKGGRRDARQVLANGLVFAACALGASQMDSALWAVAAAGALAAAGADTWATEVGTLRAATAWSLRTRRWEPAGTSGAITAAGTAALLAAAVAHAALAVGLGLGNGAGRATGVAVASGGILGALADTVIGAVGQERRHCPRCASDTEQRIHHCGTPTTRSGGLGGLDNDVVNALCTLVGALGAALVYGVWVG